MISSYQTSPERGGGPRVSVAEGFRSTHNSDHKNKGEFVQSKTDIVRIRLYTLNGTHPNMNVGDDAHIVPCQVGSSPRPVEWKNGT